MSSLQQHIDKLNPLSNDVNRLLRLIRFLDKKIQIVQTLLIPQQRQFENKLKILKQGKMNPIQLKSEYESIVAKQKEIYGFSKQKQSVAGQLADITAQSFSYISNELKQKIKDSKPSEQQNPTNNVVKKKKNKQIDHLNSINKVPQKQQQVIYNPNELKYCYCNRGSFGEMVGCEHPYCEKEWFHLECVDEKSVSGTNDWYCNDCIKLKDKFKKPALKEFI